MAAILDVQRPENTSVKLGDDVGSLPRNLETVITYVFKNTGDAAVEVGNKEPSIANAVGCTTNNTNTPGLTVLDPGETFTFTVSVTPTEATFSFDINVESDLPTFDVPVNGVSPASNSVASNYGVVGRTATRVTVQTRRRR